MTPKPANPTQMWLARGAIALLVGLLVLLKWSGLEAVTSTSDGDATVYSGFPLSSVIFGGMGAVVFILSVVFWMQPGRFYTLISLGLFLMAIFILFNAPTGLDHRVVVTPAYFYHRIGSWYRPTEGKVYFDSLVYITVGQ